MDRNNRFGDAGRGDARHPVRHDPELVLGRAPPDMLRFVASGPFPAADRHGHQRRILGLLAHFTLMAVMVAVLSIAATSPISPTGRSDGA